MKLRERALLSRCSGSGVISVLLEAYGLKSSLKLLPLLSLIQIELLKVLEARLVNLLFPHSLP